MRILVCGATGFIGRHLVNRLLGDGHTVVGTDIQPHRDGPAPASRIMPCDLRDPGAVAALFDDAYDEVYQLAADMGGAGYIFSGENDAEIMKNSALININVLNAAERSGCKRIFFASSACVYPYFKQIESEDPRCEEDSVYPAFPDSEYGWEKLFSERLYQAAARNGKIAARIARFHNIFGPNCSWNDGREKVPAALARKIAECENGGKIEIWGDGRQTRSFLYIDECLEGVIRLMRSNCCEPLNLGSEEMVSINQLADMLIAFSGKSIGKKYVDGPQGVRGRNSDNRRIRKNLGWAPSRSLAEGLEKMYSWIAAQVAKTRSVDHL